MSISKSKFKKLKKAGKLRDKIEIWVDKHNHKMELVRTLTSIVGVVLSCIIMLKVFRVI